jgi:hypothetical protein
MSIIPLFKMLAAIIIPGILFYFCLGLGALVLNMTDIEDNVYGAAIVYLLFLTPDILLFVVGIRFVMSMRKDTRGAY